MWKVFYDLIEDLKDCYGYIKENGDNYEDIMKNDNSSEYEAGVISTIKHMITSTIPFIKNSLIITMDHKWAMARGEAMASISNDGIPNGFSTAIDALENLEHSGEEYNVIWWQGYLRGYECAVANVQLQLTDQHNLLLKEIELGKQ